MTLRRKLVHALDRPGARGVLALMATQYARSKTNADVRIFYDDGWIHRVGTDYVPDSARFDYYGDNIASWESDCRTTRENIRDFWFHLYTPSAGDVIVDIGAGIGTETPTFSKAVGPGGTVLAVEAHPVTFRRLQTVCKYAGLANVVARQKAIVDGRRAVYIDDGPQDESNAISLDRRPGQWKGAVPGVSLDELCSQEGIDHIDFLKMNIEGAERLAIKGMANMAGNTRCVCIACHDHRGGQGDEFRTKDEVIDFLRAYGFEVSTRDRDRREFVRGHVHGVRA